MTATVSTGLEHFIENEDQLRAIYGAAEDFAVRKCLDRLDRHARAFIAASPFLIMASHDGRGNTDCSPRGDFPGFVEVIDDHHLLLPDRPGNNRLDSLVNILACPTIGLLFLVPSIRQTLRVNGMARITCDPALLGKHGVDGKLPKTGLLIRVEEMFLHCAKALMRSQLWKPDSWPEKGTLTSAGRIWADHLKGGLDADTLDRNLERNMPGNLW
ncbi:pyridoxamine 5'-phosphate oxidase family protein [Sphingomonas sp.]|uniref:pyridoxamine 5'-phosphate oxidase family protein n=1 Tax=Sphingomonas sp. TaxID=28214 RepID=UPI003D6D758A